MFGWNIFTSHVTGSKYFRIKTLPGFEAKPGPLLLTGLWLSVEDDGDREGNDDVTHTPVSSSDKPDTPCSAKPSKRSASSSKYSRFGFVKSFEPLTSEVPAWLCRRGSLRKKFFPFLHLQTAPTLTLLPDFFLLLLLEDATMVFLHSGQTNRSLLEKSSVFCAVWPCEAVGVASKFWRVASVEDALLFLSSFPLELLLLCSAKEGSRNLKEKRLARGWDIFFRQNTKVRSFFCCKMTLSKCCFSNVIHFTLF